MYRGGSGSVGLAGRGSVDHGGDARAARAVGHEGVDVAEVRLGLAGSQAGARLLARVAQQGVLAVPDLARGTGNRHGADVRADKTGGEQRHTNSTKRSPHEGHSVAAANGQSSGLRGRVHHRERMMFVHNDPAAIDLAQPDGDPQPVVGVGLELRRCAAAQQRVGERHVGARDDVELEKLKLRPPGRSTRRTAATTSRYSSMPRTPLYGGGTSNITMFGSWSTRTPSMSCVRIASTQPVIRSRIACSSFIVCPISYLVAPPVSSVPNAYTVSGSILKSHHGGGPADGALYSAVSASPSTCAGQPFRRNTSTTGSQLPAARR